MRLESELIPDGIRQTFGQFETASAAMLTFRIEITSESRFLRFQQSPNTPYPVELKIDGERLALCSPDFQGTYDAALRKGGLLMGSQAKTDERVYLGNLQNYARIVAGYELLHAGGLMIHSAGIVAGQTCAALFGPSGSGKTTSTLLARESHPIINDDLLLLTLRENTVLSHPHPFHGADCRQNYYGDALPVSGFYRLKKADHDSIQPLTKSQAVSSILSSVPFFSAALGDLVLGRVEQLVERVPVFELYFKKDIGFLSLLEAGVSS